MFTGIIEELGKVRAISRVEDSLRLSIEAKTVLEGLKRGDSISVNGTCLTVVKIITDSFSVDVVPETLKRTNLGDLKVGERVNLERALRLSDRLGGHIVLGHIDGVGVIVDAAPEGKATVLRVRVPQGLIKYILPQGSIAVDGISLTVVDILDDIFSISIIPFTKAKTTLGFKRIGDRVNLEVDILGKYAEKILKSEETGKSLLKGGLSLKYLAEHGFID